MIAARFSMRPRYAGSSFSRFPLGVVPAMVLANPPPLRAAPSFRTASSVRRGGQEPHRARQRDGRGEHALVLGAHAAPPARHDLPVGRGVAAESVRALVIHGPDVVDAEAAVALLVQDVLLFVPSH